MELLILRHGRAVELGTEGITRDEDRFLTSEGEVEVAAVGHALRRADAVPERVLSSPLLRARQTTERVLGALGSDAPIELRPELKPGATPMGIMALIASHGRDAKRVLIVGHQPDLGRFVGTLLGQERLDIRIAPGGLARVDIENPGRAWVGPLIWLWDRVCATGFGDTA